MSMVETRISLTNQLNTRIAGYKLVGAARDDIKENIQGGVTQLAFRIPFMMKIPVGLIRPKKFG